MSFPSSDQRDRVSRLHSALMRITQVLLFRDHPPSALAALSLSQLRCMRTIEEHEGEKMQDLAAHLGVTLPAISQIADRLVKRGMAERHHDEEDRRIVRLFLSDSARLLLEEGREGRRRRIERALAGLTAGETESTILALERLAEEAEDPRITEEITAREVPGRRAESGSRKPNAMAPSAGLSPRVAEAGQ